MASGYTNREEVALLELNADSDLTLPRLTKATVIIL